MDKASTPIVTFVDRYLSACHSAGMSSKTIRSYNEKLKRYMRMVGGTLSDFNLETIRCHLTNLQNSKKWQGHPCTPPGTQTLSTTTVRNHARVLTSFARWLYNEEYTTEHVLTRLKIPKATEIRMEPLSEEEITRLMASFNLKFEIE